MASNPTKNISDQIPKNDNPNIGWWLHEQQHEFGNLANINIVQAAPIARGVISTLCKELLSPPTEPTILPELSPADEICPLPPNTSSEAILTEKIAKKTISSTTRLTTSANQSHFEPTKPLPIFSQVFLSAQQLFAEKEYQKAADALKFDLHANLTNAEKSTYFSLMGDCMLGIEKHFDAIANYYQAMNAEPNPQKKSELLQKIVKAHVAHNEINQAIIVVNEALTFPELDEEQKAPLFVMLEKLHLKKEIQVIINQATKILAQGRSLFDSANYNQAITFFIKGIELAKNTSNQLSAKLYYHLGLSYYKQQSIEDFKRSWDWSIDLEENVERKAELIRYLAYLLANIGQLAEAKNRLRKAMESAFPEHTIGSFVLCLVRILEKNNQKEKACEELLKILESKKYAFSDDTMMQFYGRLGELKIDDKTEFEKMMRKGLSYNNAKGETKAEFHIVFAHGMVKHNSPTEAILLFKQALFYEIPETSRGSLCLQLANLLKDNGDFEEAIDTCKAGLISKISNETRAQLIACKITGWAWMLFGTSPTGKIM